MNRARFKVADPELGVFQGATHTQPERARQAAHAFQAMHGMRRARTGEAAASSGPRARVEALLSLLELEHNAIAAQPSTHETATEIDRKSAQAALESLAMLATGALRATIARPDLCATAALDAARASAAAGDAQSSAAGPLAKTVAAQLAAAAATASELAGAMGGLPGGAAPPAPSSPHRPPPAAADEVATSPGDDVAGDEPRPRRRAGVGWLAAGGLAAVLFLGGRRRR